MNKVNFLFIIAIVAVAVAFFNVMINLDKIKTITGYATGTGTANLTVESSASVNFTTNNINWGSGIVTSGQSSATLNTAGGVVTNGNWTAVSNGLVFVNIGNVNVTLDLGAGKTAAGFLGGTSPSYEWNITNIEANSCNNVSGIVLGASWNTNSSARICNPLAFLDASDSVRIDIKLVVPYDTSTGAKSDIITATATAV